MRDGFAFLLTFVFSFNTTMLLSFFSTLLPSTYTDTTYKAQLGLPFLTLSLSLSTHNAGKYYKLIGDSLPAQQKSAPYISLAP